jgi:transcriptional regulator with XRE-family HTH domain
VPVAHDNPIGEYLRARRELVRPEDIGVPDISARRRVHGLRREEVAMLAGVSSDYYVRLEQGRDQHPSPQVLDALARALQLDDAATAHLHRLATPPARRRRKTPPPEKVPAGILGLIASWSQSPAYVFGRYMDVLAVNTLATALVPFYAKGGKPRSCRLPRPARTRHLRKLGGRHDERGRQPAGAGRPRCR